MIVNKLAIGWIKALNDGKLISATEGILLALLNAILQYPTLPPMTATTGIAKDDLKNAIASVIANGGGTTLTSIKNDKRVLLEAELLALAGSVSLIAKGDLTMLLLSAIPLQKNTRTPAVVPAAPTGLTGSQGVMSRSVNASVTPDSSVAVFSWQAYSDLAPTVIIACPMTTASYTTISGLDPLQVWNIQAAGTNTVTTSAWSPPFRISVI